MHSQDRNRPRMRVMLMVPFLAALFLIGCVTGAGQPRMEATLGHLRSARAELQGAMANKGGHRVRAIRLVNRAIAEVQAGMAYAAR